MTQAIKQYLVQVQHVLDEVRTEEIARVIQLLLKAHRLQRRIFIMGNGGSAATASHFACDLSKGATVAGCPRFPVIALTDNVPLITAWANDTAYENIFAQQLAGLIGEGDIAIGISGSGNSANVLNAMRLARARSAITVGLTGFDGGQLKRLVDLCLHVPSSCMEQVEDVHMILAHLITTRLREALRERITAQTAAGWHTRDVFSSNGMFRSLAEQLTRSLKVTVSAVMLLDREVDAFTIQAANPIRYLENGPLVGQSIPLDEVPVHGRVVSHGHPVLYKQHEPAEAISAQELELTLMEGMKSGALLPIKVNGNVTGIVSLGEMRDWERSPFTKEKLQQGVSLIDRWVQTNGHIASGSLPRREREE